VQLVAQNPQQVQEFPAGIAAAAGYVVQFADYQHPHPKPTSSTAFRAP
jgi:hypothetical protein